MVQFIGNRWVQSCGTRIRKKEDIPFFLILIGLFIVGKGSNNTRIQYCKNSHDALLYIRAIQGHTGGDAIALELMGHVLIPLKWKEFLFHRGCSFYVKSILEAALIAGGKGDRRYSSHHRILGEKRLKEDSTTTCRSRETEDAVYCQGARKGNEVSASRLHRKSGIRERRQSFISKTLHASACSENNSQKCLGIEAAAATAAAGQLEEHADTCSGAKAPAVATAKGA